MRGYVNALGHPNQQMCELYAERASGGYSLVYVHDTVVDQNCSPRGELILANRDAVTAFSALADAIRASGAVPGIQIVSHWQSDFPLRMSSVSEGAIEELIDRHVLGARLAVEAGFQVINVHGAHGWPAMRFMSRLYNDRADKYGDPTYVPARVTEAIRAAIGSAASISWRVSVNEFAGSQGITPPLMRDRLMPPLVDAGTDLFDLSVGRGPVEKEVRNDLAQQPFGLHSSALAHLKGFKGAVSVPVSVCGRVISREGAEAGLQYGDLVGLGRQAIADPQAARKILGVDASPINTCIGCNYCFKRTVSESLPIRCAVNWGFGRTVAPETLRVPAPTGARGTTQRLGGRVLVVGGGPAGLTAAVSLARTGYTVTLREARPRVGGELARLSEIRSLNLQILHTVVERLLDAMEGLSVQIETNAAVDSISAECRSSNWEGIVVATGASHEPLAGLPEGVASRPAAGVPANGQIAILAEAGEGAEWAVELAGRGEHVALLDTSERALTAVYDYSGLREEALRRITASTGVDVFEQVRLISTAPGPDGSLGIQIDSSRGKHVLSAKKVYVSSRHSSSFGAPGTPSPVPMEDPLKGDSLEYQKIGHVPVLRVGDCVRPLGIAEAIDAGERAAISLPNMVRTE